ncbi:NACHT and WD repeat domain-containing protein [Gordonia phthalatica]|uniref:WD-40 repeat protein n=1 Tax=Gordonia phthalatica TaxID=1136941 RepID=A0A0N7FU41_9ACTN|nr:AAA family ATPase [Gordonia phthalatica]ALG83303.1 WD-40 repeat protein [Gordonia phthalatica]
MTTLPPESEFGPALANLFRQAGKPTLRKASESLSGRGRPEVTQQRISDWRNGRHVPRDFATVEPLIMWLNLRALDAGADDLLSMPQWRELWRRHHEPVQRIETPFVGLASMRADDRDLYFGRDDTVAALVALLERARDSETGRIVVVTGVSGAGKSSLLGAGLAGADEPWNTPIAVRAGAGEPTVPSGTPLVVVDQFEEIFALDETARRGVLARLSEISDAGSVVVLGIRADFFGQCVEYPVLAKAWQDRSMIVSEMSDEQLRSAITGPVALAGGKIDDGLADLMIDDLHQESSEGDRAGHLPLLAHALRVMWSRRSGNRLTVAAYRESGGITSALAETAEATWAALDPADQDEARAVLLALVQFGPRRAPMRASVSPTDLRDRFSPSVMRIVDAFSDARLLTVSSDSVTFIHDAVMSSWPRMADWIAADADLLQWRQQLADDADAWNRNDHRPDYLYSGGRLETALANRAGLGQHRQVLLPAGSATFLDAAEQQQVRRRRLRIGAILAVVLLAVAAVVTAVIAMGQSADLARQRNAAERTAVMSSIDGLVNSDPSLAARLLSVADKHYPDDSRVRSGILASYMSPLARSLNGHDGAVYDVVFSRDGRLLATAGNDRTVRIWERAVGRPRPFAPVATLRGFTTFVTSVTFDASARLLAAASGDGTVRVWSLADRRAPRQIATLHPGEGAAYLTRFSPSGRHLATSSDDGTVVVYRTDGDKPPVQTAVLRGHSGPVRTLAFNSAGTVLATGGEDQTVRLWGDADSDTPRPVGAPLTGFPSITHALAFLPGDRVLAVTGDSANVQLWNVADPAAPKPEDTALPGVTAGSWSIAANPEQPLLARAGFDGVIHVWNTSTASGPLPLWDLQRSPELGATRMMSTSFSPDGQELAVGRSDGGIDIWTIPSGLLPDRGALISGVDVDGTGTKLVTVGADARMNVWTDHDGTWRRRSSIGIESRANNRPRVAITTDGTLVATANNNGGLVELWDVADPEHPRRAGDLRIDTRYTYPVAFASGTRELATGETDTSIQRWDVSDPASPKRVGAPLTGPTDLIRSVSYSADGSRLVVGSDDGNAYAYRLGDAEPRATVLPMEQPVSAALFARDANYLVAGGEDLVVWKLDGDEPTVVSRIDGVYADTIGRSGTSLMVGRGTREITEFRLDDDGRLTEGSAVSPVLGGSRTVSRWVLPTDLSDGPVYPVAGDGTGVVYLQSTDVDTARAWICRTTRPLSSAERERYLGRLSADDGC